MNLELIKEITALKSEELSYTQIADTIGISKSTIVLALRLHHILESDYTKQITTLQENINTLTVSLQTMQSNLTDKESMLELLRTDSNFDPKHEIVISKEEYKKLNDELADKKQKVDILTRKLQIKNNYLNNLSLTDKINLLFQ